jgi:hypothetical protein
LKQKNQKIPNSLIKKDLLCISGISGFYTDKSAGSGGERAQTDNNGSLSCFCAHSIIFASFFGSLIIAITDMVP